MSSPDEGPQPRYRFNPERPPDRLQESELEPAPPLQPPLDHLGQMTPPSHGQQFQTEPQFAQQPSAQQFTPSPTVQPAASQFGAPAPQTNFGQSTPQPGFGQPAPQPGFGQQPQANIYAAPRAGLQAPAANTSGMGPGHPIPSEVMGWCWGGFFLPVFWAPFNGVWLWFGLSLIPFVNLVSPFVILARGREWAWQRKRWRSVNHFNSVQRVWSMVGMVVQVLVLFYLISIFLAMVQKMSQ